MTSNIDRDTLQHSGEWITPVPDSLLQNDNLTGLAKLLYICIKSHACPKNPCPFPGRETLKRMLGGVSDDSFWRYKKELEHAGWISSVQERNNQGIFGRVHYTIYSNTNSIHKTPHQKKPGPVNRIADKSGTKEYPVQEGVPTKGEEAPGFSAKLYPRELDLLIKRAEEEIEALKCCQTPDMTKVKELRSSIKGWKTQMFSLK